MRRYIFTALMVLALASGVGLAQAKKKIDAGKTQPAKVEVGRVQTAKVEITEPLKLLNVILKGDYKFVHDEDKMAKGEPCTYVYDAAGKLVVSFHCEPVERDRASQFKILVTSSAGLPEMEEYQFAGSTEGHRVPRAE